MGKIRSPVVKLPMSCKRFLLFFLSVLLTHSLLAQDSTDAEYDDYESDSTYDSSYLASIDTSVMVHMFGDYDKSIRKWRKSRDFSYMPFMDSLLKNTKITSDTFAIDEATGQTRRRSSPTISSPFLGSFPVFIFFSAVAIFLIGLVIYFLVFKNRLFVRRNTRLKITEQENDLVANDEDAFEGLINQAESLKDYNLATRYLYLQTLKSLADAGRIQYTPDKPNYLYVQEMASQKLGHIFRQLTHNYEYLWYGKFDISAQNYTRVKNDFLNFNRTI